jgi:hypothetical protein
MGDAFVGQKRDIAVIEQTSVNLRKLVYPAAYDVVSGVSTATP